MRANFSKPSNNARALKLPCRYTSQLTRKKKTWQDGLVKVLPSGNSYIIQLFDANDLRDQSLEGRLMTPKEAEYFRRKALTEMTLTNHMIEFNFETEPATYVPPVKITKFKPPSIISRPDFRQTSEENFSNNNSRYNNLSSAVGPFATQSGSGHALDSYEDVDDLWGVSADNRSIAKPKLNSITENRSINFDERTVPTCNSVHHDANPAVRQEFYDSDTYTRDDDIEKQKLQMDKPKTSHQYNHSNENRLPSRSSAYREDEDDYSSRKRKRPVPETGDKEEEQKLQRPFQESLTNTNIRGSMKRVDQSIWDD